MKFVVASAFDEEGDQKDMSGKPLTSEYAQRRMTNEPLAEIIQAKGQSETSPALSPSDEFANFEMFTSLLDGSGEANSSTGSYLRQAYGVGQELQAKLGVNPFKYGIEAGTDFHSGITSTEASNYPGSHGNQDNDPRTVITATKSVVGEPPIVLSSGGETGVWAEENTRESIFAAFKRKETFGTSGVRLKVRMFAGWNYPKDLTKQADWLKSAYEKGVSMGGDVPVHAAGGKPTFIVQAIKDPSSGNLDRVQIVKVWTKNGKSHEKEFNVVWGGDRKLDAKTGKLPPVGATPSTSKRRATRTAWAQPNCSESGGIPTSIQLLAQRITLGSWKFRRPGGQPIGQRSSIYLQTKRFRLQFSKELGHRRSGTRRLGTTAEGVARQLLVWEHSHATVRRAICCATGMGATVRGSVKRQIGWVFGTWSPQHSRLGKIPMSSA